MSNMNYLRFIAFNVGGALLWVILLVYGGYLLGNLPIVKQNFSKAILLIIFLSLLPVIIEYWRARRQHHPA